MITSPELLLKTVTSEEREQIKEVIERARNDKVEKEVKR
jgi:hypothetical protein